MLALLNLLIENRNILFRLYDGDTSVASVFRRANTVMYEDKNRLKELSKIQETEV